MPAACACALAWPFKSPSLPPYPPPHPAPHTLTPGPQVEDFPAFVVVDDKGNDFFQEWQVGGPPGAYGPHGINW